MPAKTTLSDSSLTIFQGLQVARYQGEDLVPYQMVNVRNLEGLFVEGDLSEEALRRYDIPEHYFLRAGDVVIALRGSTLKASVVPTGISGALASQNLAVVRPGTELDSIFLAGLLRSRWMHRILSGLYVQSGVQAYAVSVLTVKQLRELEIPLPSLEDQQKLAEVFQTLEHLQIVTSDILASNQNLAEAALASILGGQL